ncbi:MAG: hypothetical protein AAF573_08895, partial [Bacteroidota bacterium]
MYQKLPLLNVIAFIGLIIINFLAVQLPFFGKAPGDVSDLYPNLLTPADFTFKIWSFVYLFLGIFVYHQYQFLRLRDTTIAREVSTIGYLFLGSCILNICWLLAWQSLHIVLSFGCIFVLWLVLIGIYYKLAKLENARWQYVIPFSIYLAWICVAALASLNVLLIELEFNFFNLTEEYWTATLVGIVICGTLLVLYLNQDIWFTMVLIWAFFGIYTKNKQMTTDDNSVIFMSLLA